ncbi:nck-associated protein 5-like [Thalassophryne amazonica]|uniref:nck-associated protein 5-like n=1 Tax=Thalassophryne amazonica TaxID=390379 RepID=UPI00147216FD|nr:nck-associated protein 5-like [Thalassophryne amazonica]
MVTVQQHFSSMEETAKTFLPEQDSLEGPKVDPLDLMKAYKDKLLEEMWKQQDGLEGPTASAADTSTSAETDTPVQDSSKEGNQLLERLRALEAENSALSIENDNQRKQYERCLDEVANQVVQALLTQKDLKEACVKLRTRVFDLEQQNRILSVLFQQRVKMSASPVSQEVQRNGKASIPAGRWPSLLSLTCPRSSGSSSELSVSSTCSEYSSGSHTWAEGCGFSRQCATSREKRMSTGSVSGNNSANVEQTDLGWKEGHILKGVKHLSPKDTTSLPAAPHCKDCTSSNEGIYSLGLKCGQQRFTAEQASPIRKPFEAEVTTLDSDGADDESSKLSSKDFSDHPTKDLLCVTKVIILRDDISPTDSSYQEDPVKREVTSGHFPSPVSDNLFFLDGLSLKPGVSPTESLTHVEELQNKDLLEKHKLSSLKATGKNAKQERFNDRKSRLDLVKSQQGQLTIQQSDMESSFQNAARSLTCVGEARQRSSSMDIPHCRHQGSHTSSESKACISSESPHRKPKPQPCDSARKAFILRSKSADGGPEQPKLVHSPLHQKLTVVQRAKGQPSPPGASVLSKTTNLNKTHSTSKGAISKVGKSEKIAEPINVGCVESVRHGSPLVSPVKRSKVFQPPGVSGFSKSQTKPHLSLITYSSSNDSEEEIIYNNSPSSSRKQQHQEQHIDGSFSGLRSSPLPPQPLPPARNPSLLIKPGCDSLPSSSNDQPQLNQLPPPGLQFQSQHCNTTKDSHHTNPKNDAEVNKVQTNVPTKVYHSQFSRVPPTTSISFQESRTSDSVQLSINRTVSGTDKSRTPSILPNQSILQRSQQSISEPKLSEVLPQAYSNVYYPGNASNPQNSTSRAINTAFPSNANSYDAIIRQGTHTFLVLGKHDVHDTATTTQGVKTFENYTCEPQMIHGGGVQDKVRRRIETRCNSLDSQPSVQPAAPDSGVMLDWGFDEEGWLFKRSVSVSTRPPFRPVMGMNGAKARSQSFGARYMDRPSFNRSGKVHTQNKTHSGSSLNSLGDVLPGSMSCSSSYHCPMNRSLLNNFLIEEGLTVPPHLGSSSERLQSLKHQREQARRLQIEQQFSSAFGEPVSEEPERQSTITTIEEKVMLGIEENLHKSQEQERISEVKQKSSTTLASWFGFRKSKLPGPSGKKTEPPKVKEEKKEQKITSLLGGKQAKSDKKRDRKKNDGKESSAGRRESHDAVRACISIPCPGMSLNEIQGHADIVADPMMMNRRGDSENGSAVKSGGGGLDAVTGSGCKMQTLDSGIGTIPLPESCSFFSSILHLLPKSSSTPEQSLSPPSAPGSSSEEVSPSLLPRWKVPSGFKDSCQAAVPHSLPNSSRAHIQSVPFPTVAFLQPIQPQCQPIVTSAIMCDTQTGLPGPAQGGMEPKKLTYIKSKTRASVSQQKEQTRLQLAN